jgi:hypothetical protein
LRRSGRAYLRKRRYPVCRGRQVGFPPSAYSLLNLYNCMFTQCLLYSLLCIKLMGKHLSKDMTRYSTLLHWSTLFNKCFGQIIASLLNLGWLCWLCNAICCVYEMLVKNKTRSHALNQNMENHPR